MAIPSCKGQYLQLYCLSDIALANPKTAAPQLVPDDAFIGLPARFSAEKSFLRVRSYAPFNKTRKHFDLERQVIVKGSVLVFERDGGFSSDELNQLQQRFAAGVGLYRQEGLGQILVNPPFLDGLHFTPFKLANFDLPRQSTEKAPEELICWLKEKQAEKESETEVVQQVDRWIRELVKGQCPKNSQWGQLRTIATQVDDSMLLPSIQKLCALGALPRSSGQRK